MQRLIPILLLSSSAAGASPPTDTGSTPTDTGVDPCDGNEIVSHSPLDGAVDVFYRTPIQFQLEQAAGDESIVVQTGGADVDGVTEVADDRVLFVPDAPLAPSTRYDVRLTWSCGVADTSWTTGALGDPVPSPATLVGRSWPLDLSDTEILAPAGVGPALQDLLSLPLPLLGVHAADAGGLSLVLGAADPKGAQDRCVETHTFEAPADFSENPWFSGATETLVMQLDEGGGVTSDVPLQEVTLEGAFSESGSRIERLGIRATVDTRTLVEAVGGSQPDDVCELLAAFGVLCETCPDGTSDTCVGFQTVQYTVTERPGVGVVPRTAADIDADPDCGFVPPEDTGTAPTTEPDPPTSGDPSDRPKTKEASDGGCGCNGGSLPVAWSPGLVALALLRRRRSGFGAARRYGRS